MRKQLLVCSKQTLLAMNSVICTNMKLEEISCYLLTFELRALSCKNGESNRSVPDVANVILLNPHTAEIISDILCTNMKLDEIS